MQLGVNAKAKEEGGFSLWASGRRMLSLSTRETLWKQKPLCWRVLHSFSLQSWGDEMYPESSALELQGKDPLPSSRRQKEMKETLTKRSYCLVQMVI